MTDRRQNFVH